MKKFGRKLVGAFFNLRVIVALCGSMLSIAAHELFHIILHWGEIHSIHILPGNDAIVEIFFYSAGNYTIAVEELFAYSITATALILTAMLVEDIHEVQIRDSDQRTTLEMVWDRHNFSDRRVATQQLATLLGIH